MVFIYLDVSDCTHTGQDSVIGGIKVEREKGVGQGGLVKMNSVMAAGARGVGVRAGMRYRVIGRRERSAPCWGETSRAPQPLFRGVCEPARHHDP